jgi:membrane peptidoglycan carboxypeptidase
MSQYLPNIHQLKKSTEHNSLYNFSIMIFTFFVISAITISSLSFIGSWISYQWELAPDSEKILSTKSSESTKILANDGSLLYEMFDKENREVIETMETLTDKPINKNYIPLNMQYAILGLEDSNFYYNENGVPVSNIIGAGIECITTGGSNCRGASGIYQQLVKNKTQNDEQTIDRKIQEIISSYKLGVSEDVTHDQVLNLYLNTVGFGLNAHGVQKAAKVYFRKDIKDVTLPQACFLAGLPQIPPNRNTKLTDPNSSDFAYYLNRKNTCLENLADTKKILKPGGKVYITKDQLEAYKIEEIKIDTEDTFKRYPHFVDFVIQEVAYKFLTAKGDKLVLNDTINKLFEERNALIPETQNVSDDVAAPFYTKISNLNSEIAQYGNLLYDKTVKELKTGGYTIQTTLDPTIQDMLNRNLENARYANVGANNGAGVILDGPTGGVLAMQGSRDFYNKEIGGELNQIGNYSPYDPSITANHVVGSTMKVYDYSMALNAGLIPSAYINNRPFKFGDRTIPLTNFETRNNFGPTDPMSRSLAQSYNVGAAKAAYIGGNGLNPNFSDAKQGEIATQKLREWTQNIGVKYQNTDLDIDYRAKASSFAIGAEALNLLSHVTGVNTIAQGGKLRTATPFISIKYSDRDLYKEKMALGAKAPYINNDQAMDAGVANQMSKILNIQDQNSILRGSPVTEGWNFAAKTGTATREFRGQEVEAELTVVSWSPKYTTLVWMGNTTTLDPIGWGRLYSGIDATANLGKPCLIPLINELHSGKPGQQFSTDGLSEFRGQLLTDKQKSTFSQVKNTY